MGEGYSPTCGEIAIDEELCREALRLARLLAGQPVTATPTAHALHALVCLQAARANARRADDGSLLLLAEQDRERWDAALLNEGFGALRRAGQGDELSRYHLEAGIAACHAAAPSYQATDWPRILLLYDALRQCSPSPVVDVNCAAAVSMVGGAAAGLDELDSIPERELLESYAFAQRRYPKWDPFSGVPPRPRLMIDPRSQVGSAVRASSSDRSLTVVFQLRMVMLP